MFQEIELLASVAVFLAFFAVFAYHSALAQGSIQSGMATHGNALGYDITLQEELNAYSLAGRVPQMSGLAEPVPLNPSIMGNGSPGGRMLTMGGYVYLLGGSNVTTGAGDD